jgi:hypothetical protein
MRAQHARKSRLTNKLAVAVVAVALVAGMLVLGHALSPARTSPPLTVRLLDDSGDDTTTTTTTTVPGGLATTPAPTDYTDQLSAYYGALYSVVNAVPGTTASSQVSDPSDFATQVAGLTPDELNDLYSASSEYVDYSGQLSTIQTIGQETTESAQALHAHVSRVTTVHTTKSSASRLHVVRHDASGEVVAQDLTVIPDAEPTNGSWAGDVSGLSMDYVASCPNSATTNNDPYGVYDLFAVDEGLDAAYAIYNVLSAGMPEYDIPIVGPISHDAFAAAAAVAAAVALILQVVYDTLNWFQTVSGDCQNHDIQELTLDQDNNAYQTYELLTGVAGATNEIDTNVSNLTNQEAAELAKLTTLQIEEALASPISSVPEAIMELPGPSGLLNTTPGVQEIVANAITQLTAEGQLSSSAATRDLGLAEQAESAGEDKLAFSYYQMAYQAASS